MKYDIQNYNLSVAFKYISYIDTQGKKNNSGNKNKGEILIDEAAIYHVWQQSREKWRKSHRSSQSFTFLLYYKHLSNEHPPIFVGSALLDQASYWWSIKKGNSKKKKKKEVKIMKTQNLLLHWCWAFDYNWSNQ